jgi:hypothetical protein
MKNHGCKKFSKISTLKTFNIDDDIEISYEIKRYGQEDPAKSDNVIVLGTLFLPTQEYRLNKKIRFGKRLVVMGESLCDTWGKYDEDSLMRMISKKFIGTKWVDLFREADEFLVGEIAHLDEMMKNRKKALKDAE